MYIFIFHIVNCFKKFTSEKILNRYFYIKFNYILFKYKNIFNINNFYKYRFCNFIFIFKIND